jgi:hypothetical protein
MDLTSSWTETTGASVVSTGAATTGAATTGAATTGAAAFFAAAFVAGAVATPDATTGAATGAGAAAGAAAAFLETTFVAFVADEAELIIPDAEEEFMGNIRTILVKMHSILEQPV